MQLIALTGGIAAGKSTIAEQLELLGAVRIDADQLAREAVAVGSLGLARVVDRFGDRILRADGSLDRSMLGAIVFGDTAARDALNAIVHPEVQRLALERIQEAIAVDPDVIVVYEIPLFVETNAQNREGLLAWDLVLVADAPAELRVRRLMELRGMTESEAKRRVAAQATDAERRSVADVLIDTTASEEHTREQVDALWARIARESPRQKTR